MGPCLVLLYINLNQPFLCFFWFPSTHFSQLSLINCVINFEVEPSSHVHDISIYCSWYFFCQLCLNMFSLVFYIFWLNMNSHAHIKQALFSLVQFKRRWRLILQNLYPSFTQHVMKILKQHCYVNMGTFWELIKSYI